MLSLESRILVFVFNIDQYYAFLGMYYFTDSPGLFNRKQSIHGVLSSLLINFSL